MRNTYTILLILIAFQKNFAQCQLMSERDFENVKYRLSNNRGNLNTFQSAMAVNRVYCLSSFQAKEFASYLANDRDKLDFLKSSFINITDKENFTDVMDVFRLFSSAIKLYHQTLATVIVNNQTLGVTNPNCPRNLSAQGFNALMSQIVNLGADQQKASFLLSNRVECMSTQQIVKLVGLIRDENIRLDLLKRLYPIVLDYENYSQASSLLTSNFRSLFIAFLQNPNETSNQDPNFNNPGRLELSEVDFKILLTSIQKQSFEKDKEQYIKTYMKRAYLSTKQVKQVLKQLSFDATKLELAKYLFDRCVDKQNYFLISDELQFSSSKNELNDFVKSKL